MDFVPLKLLFFLYDPVTVPCLADLVLPGSPPTRTYSREQRQLQISSGLPFGSLGLEHPLSNISSNGISTPSSIAWLCLVLLSSVAIHALCILLPSYSAQYIPSSLALFSASVPIPLLCILAEFRFFSTALLADRFIMA